MKSLFYVFLALMCLIKAIYACPAKIIIVRHVEKLAQKNHGVSTTPTGYVQSVKFGFYFLNKFGIPDAIFATHPTNQLYDTSIRQLQTIAPLENMILMQNPNSSLTIQYPYSATQYAKLAYYVLSAKQLDNKTVLICWDHYNIPFLLRDLGFKGVVPPWPKENFDNVYVLYYSKSGQLLRVEYLIDQYPVPHIKSWKDLAARLHI